ncbi:MAG: SpoIIE family protein phosphatase [Deltaproteobacteria bacterium]|nr:SpoIIE family protein phosphatase [Deltaproteobacteria bacterium]
MRPHVLGLRSRFVLLMAAGVAVISGILASYSFLESREALLTATQEQMFQLAQAQATSLSRNLVQVSQPAADLALFWENGLPDSADTARRMLVRMVGDKKDIFGMAAAFAPGVLCAPGQKTCPYAYRSNQGIKTLDLAENYDNYLLADWYQVPALTGQPQWSEPYFDEGGGNIIMTTYSVPMIRDGQVLGVITVDVALDKLGRQVQSLAVSREGWPFLVTARGTFLAAPKPDWVMRESLFSLAEGLSRPDLRSLGKRMLRGGSGVEVLQSWLDPRRIWLAYAPVKGMGWSLGVVEPEEEILAPAWSLAKKQGLTAVFGLAALVGVVWLLVLGLTRPLKRLALGASRLASGDLGTKVEGVRPGDEVGDLAQAFNGMVDDLQRYIGELTTTTAAKERIESELDMARQIQMSILPRTYPAFPHAPQFDLFATTVPAREVGGDFYDFFMLDERRLALVVGDVSGKGIPAALFMTVARTLVKNAASHYPDPATVLAEVNAQLLPDNEMCMFVTMFYGVYDLDNGKLTFANAGHPPPLLRPAGGQTSQMPQTMGMALGIMDGVELEQGELELGVGDEILVFTDGLDEAVNPAGEMFGLERVREWLDLEPPKAAPDVLKELRDYHKEFTGPEEAFDDLTLLFFTRRM